MSPMFAALRRAMAILEESGIRYSLVGGLAVSSRAAQRFTRDVDLAVSVADDAAAERLIFAMRQEGFGVDALLEHERTGRMATVRLRESSTGVVLDLLFASCGVEPEVVAGAEPLELVEGLVLPVATAAHLTVMKVLSYHPITRATDLQDLASLIPSLSDRERAEVKGLLSQIAARGYGRGLDLDARWKEVLAHFG